MKMGLPRNWEELVNQWVWVQRLEIDGGEDTEQGGNVEDVEIDNDANDSSMSPSPIKMMRGIAYNYSCIYCKIIPRPSSVCRSELYRHYSSKHFAKLLKAQFGRLGQFCLECKKNIKTNNWVNHMVGQVHSKVEMFLPPEARVPGGRERH